MADPLALLDLDGSAPLFNGEGQPDEDFNRGAKFAGHLHDQLDGLGVKYLYADSTGPMARYLTRNYRHWLWVDV